MHMADAREARQGRGDGHMKLCIDCKWYVAGSLPSGSIDRCMKPDTMTATVDLVRGNDKPAPAFCDLERKNYKTCGPDGAKWEARTTDGAPGDRKDGGA